MKVFIFKIVICVLMIPGLAMIPLGCAKRNPQQDLLKEYRKTLERQKIASAREEQEALKRVPEMTAEEHEKLGDQYLSQGNLDYAYIQYDKALRLSPNQTRIRYKMGRLFLEKGLLEEAKREFQEILNVNPRHALTHEGMGRVCIKMGSYSDAEKSFLRAIQLDPKLPQAHNFLGIIYDQKGQFDAAITQYRAAISLTPNAGELFNNLGMSLFLKGDYEKAVKAFSEGSRIDPSSTKICNNLALAFYKLGKEKETFEAFKKGGDEASAHYNLGCLYMKEERHKEAIQAFEKAIEARPGFYSSAYENVKRIQAGMEKSPGPKAVGDSTLREGSNSLEKPVPLEAVKSNVPERVNAETRKAANPKVAVAPPSRPHPPEEEVKQFFARYIDRYVRKDIEGFLSFFSSKAIQNRKDGMEGIRKTYTNFFNQSRELQYRLEELSIEDYQNGLEVKAGYEVNQTLKKGGERKVWKGQGRWFLAKEEGRFKIISLDYQHN